MTITLFESDLRRIVNTTHPKFWVEALESILVPYIEDIFMYGNTRYIEASYHVFGRAIESRVKSDYRWKL